MSSPLNLHSFGGVFAVEWCHCCPGNTNFTALGAGDASLREPLCKGGFRELWRSHRDATQTQSVYWRVREGRMRGGWLDGVEGTLNGRYSVGADLNWHLSSNKASWRMSSPAICSSLPIYTWLVCPSTADNVSNRGEITGKNTASKILTER